MHCKRGEGLTDVVLNAVVEILEREGINAFLQFPERAADLKNGVFVCLSVDKCRSLSSGLGEYLGVLSGMGGKPDKELYGRRLELELGFEIFSPYGEGFGATACLKCADKLKSLHMLFPSGIQALEFSYGEISADDELAVFRCLCKLSCTAFLIAEGDGDESIEFLDFVLKGTIKSAD